MASKKNKKKAKKAAAKAAKAAPKVHPKSKKSKQPFDVKSIGILLGILLLTFISFYPSLDNQYVNWDDDRNFYENELITTINDKTFWKNSKEIFRSDVIGNYNPLTIFTFAVEQKLSSKKNLPFYRHLNNILLHLVAVWFVFWIGVRLKLGIFGSSLLALLFAIHPMRVESVAWVTERKDVLFGAFYLASLFYYIKGKQDGFRKRDYILVAVFFILSLFSKIQAVFLPISMMLIDYYLSKDAKITVKSIINKTPLLIGSLIIGLTNIYFLKQQGSITEQEYSGISRLFIGSYSLVVYYVKALFPYRLSPLYPYPATMNWTFYASILSFVVTGAVLVMAYMRKWKVLFFGLAFFMVNIFMLLQILGAGQGFLADRFTYIAYLGLFFIMAYYLNTWLNTNPKLKLPILVGSTLLVLGYSFMTFNQNKIWKDSGTLWTHVLKYYQKSTLPWGNRANFYRDEKRTAEALSDYHKVISLKDDKPEPYNSLARLYFNFNNRDSLFKALHNYNKAIELKPSDVEYRVNRGATYAKLGDGNNAILDLNAAEKIDPSFANIYLNRSVINNQNRNYDAALIDIDKYLAIKPNFPDMWYEKARLHNGKNHANEAMKAITTALSMNSKKGIYYMERAKAYTMMGQKDKAIQDVKNAQANGHQGDPETIRKIYNPQQ